jgi:glycosyltransferase involved in cell wall biosynthesis
MSNLIFGDTPIRKPRIALDGLFFQIAKTGIARLWRSYLEHWAGTEFASHLIVLDRNHTAPRMAGITYYDVPAFDGDTAGQEMLKIEEWCRKLEIDVFISTFYSTPIATRSVMMAYDMIYELQSAGKKEGWDEEEKSLAILHASHIVAISHNTAKDVKHFYPHLAEDIFSVVHCGVDSSFEPASETDIGAIQSKFGLQKPYFLLVGTRKGFCGYKNAIFLVRALSGMKNAKNFDVACAGGELSLDELGAFKNVSVRLLSHVSESDLIGLYSGAEALVYPSRYEGFGLPIIEAMACGCPVIACPNGSIPEVAGEAALFVENDDDAGMEAALLKVGDPAYRSQLKAKGFEQARLFSWKNAAAELAEILLCAANLPKKSEQEIRVWKELREKELRLTPLIEQGRSIPKRRITLKFFRYLLQIAVSRK